MKSSAHDESLLDYDYCLQSSVCCFLAAKITISSNISKFLMEKIQKNLTNLSKCEVLTCGDYNTLEQIFGSKLPKLIGNINEFNTIEVAALCLVTD